MDSMWTPGKFCKISGSMWPTWIPCGFHMDSMESTWNPGTYVFQCFWFCSLNKIVKNLRKFDMIDELRNWRVTYCYFDQIPIIHVAID